MKKSNFLWLPFFFVVANFLLIPLLIGKGPLPMSQGKSPYNTYLKNFKKYENIKFFIITTFAHW